MCLREDRDTVTGKITHCTGFDRRDIDWRVEQKLARVLAERDLYWSGVSDGFWIAAALVFVAVIFWPEIKTATGRK